MSSHPSILSSTNASDHFYRGSFQQSAMYNTLLPTQGPSLYNGMLPAQSFSVQNNYPSSGYNGYNHIDTTLWLPDSRPSVAHGGMAVMDVSTTGKTHYTNKTPVSNSSGAPVYCSSNTVRGSVEKNITYSHSSETCKTSGDKDARNVSAKVVGLDSGWYCGQSVINYGNNQNQSFTQGNYKFNEQFASCSQMNLLFPDQIEMKQSSSNMAPYFDHFQSQIPNIQKSGYYSNSIKNMNSEQDKECLKYYPAQDIQPNILPMPDINEKPRDQESRSSQSSMFGSSVSEIHEEALYSQASLFFNSNDNQTQVNLKSSNSYPAPKEHNSDNDRSYSTYNQSNLCLIQQQLQRDSRYDMNATSMCNITENSTCAREVRGVKDNTFQDGKTTDVTVPLCNSDNLGNCAVSQGKDASSQDCGSDTTSESDIIVEETEEEVIGDDELPEIEVFGKKGTGDVSQQGRCFVCEGSGFNSHLSEVTSKYPTTTSSHTPLLYKFFEVIAEDSNMPEFYSDFMCRRCLNLLNMVDCLETKLNSTKRDILQLFGKKVLPWKVSCNLLNTLENITIVNEDMKDNNGKSLQASEPTIDMHFKQIAETIQNSNFDSKGICNVDVEMKMSVHLKQLPTVETDNISLTELTSGALPLIDLETGSSSLTDLASNKFPLQMQNGTDSDDSTINVLDSLEDSDVSKILSHIDISKNEEVNCNDNIHGQVETLSDDIVNKSSFSEVRNSLSAEVKRSESLEVEGVTIVEVKNLSSCEMKTSPFDINDSSKVFSQESNLASVAVKDSILSDMNNSSFYKEQNISLIVNDSSSHNSLQEEKLAPQPSSPKERHSSEDVKNSSQETKDSSEEVNISSTEELSFKIKNSSTDVKTSPPEAESSSFLRRDLVCQIRNQLESGLTLSEVKSDCNLSKIKEITGKEEKSKGKYQCIICSNYFSSKVYLRTHTQQHTKEFGFYCDKCGKGFTLKSTLENHLLLHMGEYRFQCEICGKRFRHRYILTNHLCKHTKVYQFSCSQCGKGFSCRSALDNHKRSHDGIKPYICECCGKCFGLLWNLNIHVRICSGNLPFQCDRCARSFPSQAKLDKHILTFHEGKYDFVCDVCNKGFSRQSDLVCHGRSHTNDKPYKCKVCNKSFISTSNLNHHSKSHVTDNESVKSRLLKCDLCNKTFSRPSALSEHIDRHNGIKSFNCDMCDKSFFTRRNLQAHRNWHNGITKTYTCEVCGKKVKNGLKVHMRSHSGEKPYNCLKCNMAFSVKRSLDKHKRKHINDP